MHGVIFCEVRDFVKEEFDRDTWNKIKEEAGVDKRYTQVDTYPDQDALDIVAAGCDISGMSKEDLLNEIGKFAMSDLIETYKSFIDDDWDEMDILEHVEDTMHRAVRMQEEDAEPPELECERKGEDKVVITYTSEKELCKLGEGLIHGIGEDFNTDLEVSQPKCMLEGNRECKMEIVRN